MKCKCGREATMNVRYGEDIGGIEPICKLCYYAKKKVNNNMVEVETTVGILKRR